MSASSENPEIVTFPMTRLSCLPGLLITLLIGACAAPAPHTGAPQTTRVPQALFQTCTQFFSTADELVAQSKVRDAEAAVIKNFPYLRVNRFLASFRDEVTAESAFQAWVDRLQELAAQAWKVELNNLPADERQELQRVAYTSIGLSKGLDATVKLCGNTLRARDLMNQDQRTQLIESAKVPPAYRNSQRVIGLYPLTALAFSAGIKRWQNETRQIFAQAVTTLPVQGRLIRFTPPAANINLMPTEIAAVLQHSAHNALHIPEPAAQDQQRLFAAFAPAIEIDVTSADDRIGTPVWKAAKYPQIDIDKPVVYRYLSHTRYAGHNLLQLNYTFWFPARPKTGPFDLLGGQIDGLTWRVTLTPDGNPWVYDVMHNCGCYHLFFPTRHAVLKQQPQTIEELAFVPQPAPEFNTSTGLTLRLSTQSHYLQRVSSGATVRANETINYQWDDYDTLRSLPVPGDGTRSLFRADGIVSGSDRLERYLFWPMGIPHPGAMRQRGHHATAFVGRRHFDDHDLFEKYFEPAPSAN